MPSDYGTTIYIQCIQYIQCTVYIQCIQFYRDYPYILGEIRTGSPNDETLWLPNKEMTKPCEVSDETSTNLSRTFSV